MLEIFICSGAIKVEESSIRQCEKLMMSKYEIIIYWSHDDNAYIAEVPELAGCMADGPTASEAVKNVEEVIQEWIETATELGRPIPEPMGRLRYT